MKDVCMPFAGKNITILGLGLLGRGAGDAEFLAKCGARVLVTDTKTEAELAEPLERLKRYENITYHLGGHRTEDFTGCDMVVKAAGVRLDSPEVAAARGAGVPVVMSTALFATYASEIGVKIVGVTGTRGKSTISHMIYHVLRAAGKRVHLGGNIRGLSTLAMLPEMQEGDIAVLELDSWQLQGFGALQFSPHIAVFSNLMPDHQNYYRSMDQYFDDKAHIFRYQKKGDALFVGASIEPRVRAQAPIEPTVPGALPPDWILKIPGEHNRHNAALAAGALLALGLTAERIREGLETFEAVEGRLQLLTEKDGVAIYNDNNATTPEATIAALRALDHGAQKIILIAGGSDKDLALDVLVESITETCKKVVLLPGTGTAKLQALIPGAQLAETLPDALQVALDGAKEGDILLFSPGFASFGLFKNEYERNDLFIKAVQDL